MKLFDVKEYIDHTAHQTKMYPVACGHVTTTAHSDIIMVAYYSLQHRTAAAPWSVYGRQQMNVEMPSRWARRRRQAADEGREPLTQVLDVDPQRRN